MKSQGTGKKKSSAETGQHLWQLPLFKEYPCNPVHIGAERRLNFILTFSAHNHHCSYASTVKIGFAKTSTTCKADTGRNCWSRILQTSSVASLLRLSFCKTITDLAFMSNFPVWHLFVSIHVWLHCSVCSRRIQRRGPLHWMSEWCNQSRFNSFTTWLVNSRLANSMILLFREELWHFRTRRRRDNRRTITFPNLLEAY